MRLYFYYIMYSYAKALSDTVTCHSQNRGTEGGHDPGQP